MDLQVSMVSRLKHENFVQLLGYCVDGNSRILAYEFASNGSLHDILHGMCDDTSLIYTKLKTLERCLEQGSILLGGCKIN